MAKSHFIDRHLTIGAALGGAGLLFIVSLGISGLSTAYTLSAVGIGSTNYQRIVAAKDLLGDILPPPEYVIEAYLEANLVAGGRGDLKGARSPSGRSAQGLQRSPGVLEELGAARGHQVGVGQRFLAGGGQFLARTRVKLSASRRARRPSRARDLIWRAERHLRQAPDDHRRHRLQIERLCGRRAGRRAGRGRSNSAHFSSSSMSSHFWRRRLLSSCCAAGSVVPWPRSPTR